MPATKTLSQPLYPAYLPTRPDGYAATIDVPPFEGDEPGTRADPAKPHLLRPDVKVTNITPRIGTELTGIQLSKLSQEGLDVRFFAPRGVNEILSKHSQIHTVRFSEVAQLAAERGVLVFRDQDFADIGFERQLEIARHYGPLHQRLADQHPTMGYPEGTGPEFHVVYADENAGNLRTLLGPRTSYDLWHIDQTFTRNVPSTTFFWVLEMPASGGGDTAFTSLTAAYEALSPTFKSLLAPLSLFHTSASVGEVARLGTERALREAVSTIHPLVIRHPVTDKPSLFVNPTIARRIEGMLPEESDILLKFLNEHIRSLDFSCRVRWEKGSVVVWDQRSAAHTAVPDFKDGERRHMVRVIPYGSQTKPAFPDMYGKTNEYT